MTGSISKDIGRKLNLALSFRNKARYDPQANLTKDDCLSILSLISELSLYIK